MILENIKRSYAQIPYTWKHKKAMIMLEKKFTGRITWRILKHDVDKLIVCALCPFLSTYIREVIHHTLSSHHSYLDIAILPDDVLQEIVLDWESAHYTKIDKPLNAVDFCIKFRPNCYPYLKKYFDKWGLKSTCKN